MSVVAGCSLIDAACLPMCLNVVVFCPLMLKLVCCLLFVGCMLLLLAAAVYSVASRMLFVGVWSLVLSVLAAVCAFLFLFVGVVAC